MPAGNNNFVDTDAKIKDFLNAVLSSEGIVVDIRRTFINYNGVNRSRVFARRANEMASKGGNVTLTNDSFQNDDMVDGAAIYLNSPVLASVKKGSAAYIFTPSGKQLDYVCIDAFNSQSEDGTIVSDGADLIVYAYLEDGTTIRVARFSRN